MAIDRVARERIVAILQRIDGALRGLGFARPRIAVQRVVGQPLAANPGLVSGVLAHVTERIALGDLLPPDLAGEGQAVSVGSRMFHWA